MSYFASPNFIIYDEWFDDDFKKTNLDVKNKSIKTISNIHEFFYVQSNYKVGASENNLLLDIKLNKKELVNTNHLKYNSAKHARLSFKKMQLFERFTKSKLKFNPTKKIIYSLSIFSFVFILGFLLFFISQSKKNKPNTIYEKIILEKKF